MIPSLVSRLLALGEPAAPAPARGSGAISLEEWMSFFSFDGLSYPVFGSQTLGGRTDEIPDDFTGLAQQAYKSNGVVFACLLVRQLLFSEARFQFRRRRDGRPGEMFGGGALAPLESPHPGGTTGDLLARAIQDADLTGNWYGARMRGGIRRLRPDWVTIVLGSDEDPEDAGLMADAEAIGYLYHPGGRGAGREPVAFPAGQVAHFAPIPDPLARFRGMSWLAPVLREIRADQAMTDHQRAFMDKGATPNMIAKLDPSVTQEAFDMWVTKFKEQHEGAANAYRTIFLGGGADVEVVGANFEQLSFKETRGSGETRIAAAAGVPPVIVGLSEGLAAATYSNYAQARRRFADGTMRPLWRNMAGSLAAIIDVPGGAELWYDDRDVPFLQEDVKDDAEIQRVLAQTIRGLVDGGFTPASAVAAAVAGDMSLLVHTGLYSVQLQQPGRPFAPNGSAGQEAGRRAIAAPESG